MHAIYSLESGLAGCLVDLVIVAELRDGEPLGPVVLLVVTEASEVSLKLLVSSFGEAVCFWVIGRREVSLYVKLLVKCS